MATITTIKERIISLDQASFQILCDAYLSKEGYPNIVALGTKAGAQKTTLGTPDTYFFTDDKKYVFVEYTTQQTNLAAKIEEDLNKCLDEKTTGISVDNISEIIYCHTSSNISPRADKQFRDQCRSVGIKLTIIGVDVLAEQLLNKYSKLVKDHLALTIDTEQIQNPNDFISQYNANGLSAPLDTPFLFRDKELADLETAFEAKNIVVLTGSAGVGKTKMALEYAQQHAEKNNEILYCIHDRSLPMNEDLCAYLETPGAYFLVIDDANQISNIGIILDYVNKQHLGYYVKAIITVRDYAIDIVKYQIGRLTAYDIIHVEPFSDEQIKELLRTSLGILNDQYLDRIVRIAEGNSRMAILAGKIACQTNRLASINDATQLYEEYYGRVLREAELLSNEKLLVAAGIIAFLNSVHLDRLEPINEFLLNHGMTCESFKKSMFDLHQMEIVNIYHDKAAQISEQCFSNFLLKYVFCDRRLISLSDMIETCFEPYRGRVIESVNTIVSVFREANVHSYVESEIKALWKKMYNGNPHCFMYFLKVFHEVDSTETLIYLDRIIAEMEPVTIPVQSIDTSKDESHPSIDDDVLSVLGSLAHDDEFDTAMDLFFKYYIKRPDKYYKFYHTIKTYYNIDNDALKYGCLTQIKLINKIVQYSNNWTNEYVQLLFNGIAPILLNLHFSPSKMNARGKSIVIYDIFLTAEEEVLEYRRLLWEQLLQHCVHQKDIVKDILYGYGQTIDKNCYDVIKYDYLFINRLVDLTFSIEQLSDSIISQRMRRIFQKASVECDVFDKYLNSEKMKLYQLLVGPQSIELDDDKKREAEKERQIKLHIENASDERAYIKCLLAICKEATVAKHANSYELNEGINIVFKSISDDTKLFIESLSFAFENGYTECLVPNMLLKTLFNMLPPKDVLSMVQRINAKDQRNIWEFNYYSEIPTEYINPAVLDDLYLFLSSKDDAVITHSPYRDISLFKKYETVDSDIILNCARIVFAKKEYSPWLVKIYLERLLLVCSPQEAISLFSKDIGLLESVYLLLEQQDRYYDYDGEYLVALCEFDSEFLNKYICETYDNAKEYCLVEKLQKCCSFFQCDKYINYFDTIVDVLVSISYYPIYEVSNVIGCFLPKAEDEGGWLGKARDWALHYIETNAFDTIKMQCLFEALTNSDTETRVLLTTALLRCNKDFDFFKSLPLTPGSYSSDSGSFVPVYVLWEKSLKQLLPCFPGLTFIHHKKYIEDAIESIQKLIVDTEISDIIKKSHS